MKNLIVALFISAVFVSNDAKANVTTLGNTTVEVTSVAGGKFFLLSINQLDANALKLTLENEAGENLFSESLTKANEFHKKFIVSSLPSGKYFLVVTKNHMTAIQPIEVTDNGVNILENGRIEKFEPWFRQTTPNKIDVDAFFTTASKVELKIWDNEGNLAYHETLNERPVLHKRFDVSKLPAGNYSFQVVTNTDQYSYNFTK